MAKFANTNIDLLGLFAGFLSTLTNFRAVGLRLYRNRQARLATAHLLTQDDRILRDIGVSRGDVEQALAASWDQDPSEILATTRRRRLQEDRQGIRF